ncbi:MAG: hypothetical protein E7467_07415 [Ruminococcaceae bacterium]|nr:hypothetical protein [Oscillospiraceae bacterium]
MKHLFKRSLALLCVLAMIIGILPMTLAADEKFVLASEIKDGNKIVIVCAAEGQALGSEIINNYYKAGVAVTPEGDAITAPDDAIVWTVSADGEGFNLTNFEGHKLSIDGTYNSIPYDKGNDAWHLEAAETEGCVYVVNENGKHLSWSSYGNFTAQDKTSQHTNEGYRAMAIYVLGAEGEGGGEELPEPEIAGEFVLLSTTDMHGRCWDTNILNDTNMSNSMLNVATAVKEMREVYGENVVLIDNGDTYQGTPVSTLQISEYTQGNTTDPNPMAISLKYIGYDLATVGNHEFNYAWSTMSDIYDYLQEDVEGLGNVLPACANLYYEDGTNVVEPYGIKTIKDEYGDEYKIAILAFVTPDCTRWDVPDNYPGMRFYHPDNAYRSIRWEAEKWVKIIEEAEAPDFVIVTFHSGAGSVVADEDLVYGENTENQVASMIAGTTGIDVVIAGHDHNGGYSGDFFQNADGEDVLVVNGAGNNLTASVFEIDMQGNIALKEHSDLSLSSYAADTGLKALIKPYADAASAYVNNTCGKAIGTWNKITSGKNFYLQQSDTMDLIGRAQIAQGTIHLEEKFDTEEKKQALFAETGLTDLVVDASSTSVVVNGTYNVSAGDLSMKDIYRMYKYDNSLYLMPVTGAELRGFLEFNAATHLTANTASGTPIFGTKGDDFTNPIFYGLDFKYDLSREEYDRVVDLKFSDGREVVDEEVYIFAVNNYHLGNASGPFASYTTEDAIWSQTDDMGGGFVQDLIAEFLAAETAANGGVAPAPSNWEIVYTGEIVEGKAEGEFIGDACDPTKLETGDQVLIYYPAGNTLVSNIADGAKLAVCEDVTYGKNDAGIRQVGTDTAAAVFTVTMGEDGMISFSDAAGLYITSAPTGNGLSMGAELNDLAKWEIEKTESGIYLRNVGAAHNGNHNQYLEFYYAFTTYGLNGGGAAYTFEIFKLPAVEEESDEIVILYTNDVHTYVDKTLSYDNIADMKATLEAEGKTVILVDAGDHIQGTAYGSMDKGATIIELMEAAGYDLATLGNHEFDYGMERALEIAQGSAFPYISANFYHEKDGVKGETVLPPFQYFFVDDMVIAMIGITTPESFTKSTPAYFQDENGNYIYGISGGEDGAALYADVQAAIDNVRNGGADYVIALGHLGDDPASQPWTSEELIANTTGLDAFIDGHSHSTVEGKLVADKEGNEVLLTQTGEYFGAIGKMTIGAEGISTELVTEWTGSDEAVAEIKNAWIAEITEKLGEVIGTTDVTFDNYDAEGNRMVRKYETNTGDFAADALYYLFDSMDMDVDVAIMNGGGVRNKAITGEISYLTCKNIHTFGNVACLQTVTGQQILDALEWGARQTPAAEVGGFLHVAGMTYEVDASIESTVQADDKGVWIGGPTGEYRVKNVKVYNKETGAYEDLDLTASYNMAGYNYTLRDLGDGFAMFDGAINVLDYVAEDYQVLATYVKAFPAAEGELPVVSATNSPLLSKYEGMLLDYGTVNGSGRIVVAGEVEEPWDGVIIIGGLEPNLWTTKYGNVYTNCAAENFVNDLGLSYGDLATVKFLDQELILPVVPDYSYVDSGKPALLVAKNEQGNPTGYAFMAINMGNFLETYGIATKGTDENGNWFWTACEGVEFPIVVTFELYEKEGYMAEYLLHELSRTNNREDYADLTDEEFANFREVTTTGMGDDVLYRSSSPINPELGRNTYADAAAQAAGVKTFVNLADSKEEAEAYEGFAETYYSKQNVIYLCLGVDFAAEDFQKGLAEGFRFMIANEGPYLIHCTEGKDRAGFTNALLECFMGATYDEVIADYMKTYVNYYGVEVGSEKYTAIANSNIIKSLTNAFGVEDLTKADLAAEAEEYLLAIGLTAEEVDALNVALGGKEDPKPTFEDVKEGQWYYDYVTIAAELGLVRGMTPTTFEPETNMTRAMLVTVLYRAEGEPSVEGLENPFADVAENQWYTDAIIWAASNKIVNGTTPTTFTPDANITREQIVTILYRYAVAKGEDVAVEDTELAFPDAGTISSYAVDAMTWAVDKGIINGMDGKLAPQASATRAMVCTMLVRYLGYIE